MGRENDAKEEAEHAAQKLADASRRFIGICSQLDADGSGSLSKEELIKGFETNKEFADTMEVMGFKQENMNCVFAAFDSDGSGDVNYAEFVDNILEAKNQDLQTMLLFVKLNLAEMQMKVTQLYTNANHGDTDGGLTREPSGPKHAGSSKDIKGPAGAKLQEKRTGVQIEGKDEEKEKDNLGKDSDDELLGMLRNMAKKINEELRMVIGNGSGGNSRAQAGKESATAGIEITMDTPNEANL